MLNNLQEYIELWHRFNIGDLGMLDKEDYKRYMNLQIKIKSALKLQELVNEEIKECKRNAGGVVYGMSLKSLVSKSEVLI